MTTLLVALVLAVLAEMRLTVGDVRARVTRLEDLQLKKFTVER